MIEWLRDHRPMTVIEMEHSMQALQWSGVGQVESFQEQIKLHELHMSTLQQN